MQNNQNKTVDVGKMVALTALGTVSVLIIAAVILFTPWVQLDNSPKPLGSGLEYIGKKDYGCGGFIGVCDAAPGTTYYYATNLSLEETEMYFNKANIREKPLQESYGEEEGEQYRISYINKDGSKSGFYIIFYNKGDFTARKYHINSINKKHLIEIDYSFYESAKSAL